MSKIRQKGEKGAEISSEISLIIRPSEEIDGAFITLPKLPQRKDRKRTGVRFLPLT